MWFFSQNRFAVLHGWEAAQSRWGWCWHLQMGHTPSQKGRRGRSLTGKIARNSDAEKLFFHSLLFFVKTARAASVYFPPRKKKHSACNSRNGNLQLNRTRAAILLNILLSLWHLIMRILGSANNIKCTWATCQIDWMSAAEQNTTPA